MALQYRLRTIRCLFILVAATAGACSTPTTITEPPESATAVCMPLLPAVTDIDATTQPNDIFKVDSKSGEYRNDSLSHRRMDAADRILASVKLRLNRCSPEQLIGGLRLFSHWPANETEYYVWRDGNKLIEEELRRRGEAAKPALLQHADDTEMIFDGAGGPGDRVGDVCRRVLVQ